MKIKYFQNLLFVFAISTCALGFSQESSSNNEQETFTGTLVCEMPATDIVNNFKNPRAEIVRRRMENSNLPSCSTFIVDYNGFVTNPTGGPGEAQVAFQFAVDIWASLIESSVPIRIQATFEPAANNNNLGSAAPAFYREVPGEVSAFPNTKILYPAALFEKLTGEDRDGPAGESIDIVCNFNSGRTDWYFGLDGTESPSGIDGTNQFDFVTVVLHELGHGLGVAGFGREIATEGFIRRNATGTGYPLDGSGEYASVWDTYIQANRSQGNLPTPILDEAGGSSFSGFPDPSPRMLSAFNNESLNCYSPLAVQENNGTNPKTQGPIDSTNDGINNPVFSNGSSYSHWDESTFNNTATALMTPFSSREEANHNPGTITLGFMEDMGWSLCQGSLSTEDFAFSDVNISPNPFAKSITINLPSSLSNDNFKVSLIDINGRVLFSNTPQNNNGELTISNLENLEAALYFLTLESTTSNVSITKKIVKK